MKPGEEYDLKRIHFIEKATNHFRFLCDEFGYSGPKHTMHEQENEVVIADRLEFSNDSIDRVIVLYNAYHPNDYGFELHIYRPSISMKHSERLMMYYVLKEDQDIEQTYLIAAAKFLREQCMDIIAGQEWKNSI